MFPPVNAVRPDGQQTVVADRCLAPVVLVEALGAALGSWQVQLLTSELHSDWSSECKRTPVTTGDG